MCVPFTMRCVSATLYKGYYDNTCLSVVPNTIQFTTSSPAALVRSGESRTQHNNHCQLNIYFMVQLGKTYSFNKLGENWLKLDKCVKVPPIITLKVCVRGRSGREKEMEKKGGWGCVCVCVWGGGGREAILSVIHGLHDISFTHTHTHTRAHAHTHTHTHVSLCGATVQ